MHVQLQPRILNNNSAYAMNACMLHTCTVHMQPGYNQLNYPLENKTAVFPFCTMLAAKANGHPV
eukprot:304322-Chlamydomonas_euryale.AAC.2